MGRAVARQLARYGAKVVVGDVDPAGEETVDLIRKEGGDALFVRTDVAAAKDVQNLVAKAVEAYGGLHCAFNNAGVLPATATLAHTEETAFDDVMAVDLRGVFLCLKYEIRQRLKNGGGAIVNNASVAGIIAEPGSHLCRSKTWRDRVDQGSHD